MGQTALRLRQKKGGERIPNLRDIDWLIELAGINLEWGLFFSVNSYLAPAREEGWLAADGGRKAGSMFHQIRARQGDEGGGGRLSPGCCWWQGDEVEAVAGGFLRRCARRGKGGRVERRRSNALGGGGSRLRVREEED
ncbi:unnamed protein product [Linum trigynum]|uniref:Uncharacterized protein n=1 Tax=Linum trigynum TaxID=586398 RepID=A0AAV2CC86_9ROSI